ncbi:tetratricopeptide repeat protein [Massilia sp. TS11]|uniref:tetratricopeptide repeat protein n=1 Tax=Massilia sp. TS11 TaxID=2908003 RepID=UPI001EDB9735|nr:tetratricopeptide repeat protein [Massilia sp. TS11]MCG2586833.1 sel1 repeat family protein [Massilia sp. TS11]
MVPFSSRWIAVTILVFSAILGKDFGRQHLEYSAMHTTPSGLPEFDVNRPLPICGRWKETMPKQRDVNAYHIYMRARRLWHSNFEYLLSKDSLASVLRDVSTAAQLGDWGAQATLSDFYIHGLGHLEVNKTLEPDSFKAVEIYRAAVAAGQAWGFFNLGVAYEYGYGDLTMDTKIAWAYYLKAAELGSPEAQMALAQAYLEAKRWDAATLMQMCAYKQGHGPAAEALGMQAEVHRRYEEALRFYQDGVRFGNKDCANALWIFFDEGAWKGLSPEVQLERKVLGLIPDSARRKRYREIALALEVDPDLRFAQIDKFLPMPPAPLPAWRGIDDAVEPMSEAPPTY